MAASYRLTGLPSGAIDTKTKEIRFSLAVAKYPDLSFVARFGVLSQVIAGLARMTTQLRQLLQETSTTELVSAEGVASSLVQKESWSDKVLLELVTPEGVTYRFAIAQTDAAQIAEQLKTESAKPTEVGNA